MGFLDNFKEAMKRGQEAAQNYRERELANQAQAKGAQGVSAGASRQSAAAAGKHAPRQQAPLPDGAFKIGFTEYFDITDPASGAPVTMHLLVDGVAVPMDQGAFQGQDTHAIAKEAIIETVREKVNDPTFLPNTKDVRTMMMLSHRMQPIVVSALQGKGFKSMFKIVNLTVKQPQ